MTMVKVRNEALPEGFYWIACPWLFAGVELGYYDRHQWYWVSKNGFFSLYRLPVTRSYLLPTGGTSMARDDRSVRRSWTQAEAA